MATGMTIGRLAEQAGVHVETIRYYQRRGLIVEPDRTTDGPRCYPASAKRRVRFIKRAQRLGFTLGEIAALLALDDVRACAETRELAAHKLELIDEKLGELQSMRKALTGLVRQCDADGDAAECPILQALADD